MSKTREAYRTLSRSEGLAHIENYYLSGLSPSQYYRQHGISEFQFYSWRRRYLSLHPESESALKVKKRFHPVKIESTTGIMLSGLEIHYPNGVRIVMSNDHSIDIDKLSSLIKIQI